MRFNTERFALPLQIRDTVNDALFLFDTLNSSASQMTPKSIEKFKFGCCSHEIECVLALDGWCDLQDRSLTALHRSAAFRSIQCCSTTSARVPVLKKIFRLGLLKNRKTIIEWF